MNAVVFNKNGQVVTDLQKRNFAVFVDGAQREITDFTTPSVPLEASLIVEHRYWSPGDEKGSADLEVTPLEVFKSADVLVSQLLQSPQDEISVVTVDLRPQFLTNATNDLRQLRNAIDLLRINRPAMAEVALFDTLKLVLNGGTDAPPVLSKSEQRTFNYRGLSQLTGKRRAIIAIASGLDTLSKTSYKDASRMLHDSGIPVHVICMMGTLKGRVAKWRADNRQLFRLPQKKDLEQAEQRLDAITKESGGGHHHYVQELDGPALVNTIQAAVSGQYNLRFSADDIRDGKSHAIEVRIDADGDGVFDGDKFVVQARQVYNAPKNK